jgi:transposase
MNEHHMMTKRLVLYIAQQLLRRTFASVADDTGIDERTVRRIFQEANQHKATTTTHSSCIGIDEVHLLHKPRCVVSDITERKIIELLRDRNKATVTNYLYRLPEKSEITLVCMDMWRPYFDAVRLVLPQAQVIVDHFHVVKMANECLETVRKQLRAELSDTARRGLMHDRYILLHRFADLDASKRLILEAWTENFPKLKNAYWLKESFFNIWQASTRAEAESSYQQWQSNIPIELQDAFQPLLTAVTNWHEPIFNYFDHRVTNAYTEALNGLIKTAQRNSRGFSFEVLRTRVLQTGGLHCTNRPPVRERKPATSDVLLQETIVIQSNTPHTLHPLR